MLRTHGPSGLKVKIPLLLIMIKRKRLEWKFSMETFKARVGRGGDGNQPWQVKCPGAGRHEQPCHPSLKGPGQGDELVEPGRSCGLRKADIARAGAGQRGSGPRPASPPAFQSAGASHRPKPLRSGVRPWAPRSSLLGHRQGKAESTWGEPRGGGEERCMVTRCPNMSTF